MHSKAKVPRFLSTAVLPVAAALFLFTTIFAQATGSATEARWLRSHSPKDFTGKVWIRVRVDKPAAVRYAAIVDCETDPYKPARKAVGTLTAGGLQTLPWQSQLSNHWSKGLAWVMPETDSDWLVAGRTSPWAELPISKNRQWHCAVLLRGPGKRNYVTAPVTIEFASAPDPGSIFRISREAPDEKGAVAFRMPVTGGLKGLRSVVTFEEWARERRRLVKSIVKVPVNQPARLKIRTWVNFRTYRKGGGSAREDIAELDFQNLRDLGLNGLAAASLDDDVFGRLSSRYGMRGSMLNAWASGIGGFIRRGKGKYDLRPGESPESRLGRIFEDRYALRAADIRKGSPNLFGLSDLVILGDEISGVVRPDRIANNPDLLKYFREWLRQQRLRAADLGYESWENVVPVYDRDKLASADLPYARNFYYTRRFIDHYTELYYRSATNAVERNFPHAEAIAVNYQAGPMQFGFIGTDNNLDSGQLDIFELGRTRSFKGAMTEDWVKGWDLGIGREMFGAAVLRASARKHQLPLAAYLVGGEAVRSEMIGYVSQGIKEIDMYLYGPISNIGPAWSDNPRALEQTADAIRTIGKFDREIADGELEQPKAAMLLSTSYDIMQAGGRYLIPERQDLFVALAHSQIPIDLISEQEVLEEGALNRYKVLYVVDAQAPESVQKEIAKWVKGGGWLWASAGALMYDEFGQPTGTLDEVFGVARRKIVQQEGGIKPSAPPWTPKVDRFGLRPLDTLSLKGGIYATPVSLGVRGIRLEAAPAKATVIGKYSDGSPGAFECDFGKGKAILIGALVGNAYVNAHYPGDPQGNEGLKDDWSHALGAEEAMAASVPAAEMQGRFVKLSVPGIYTSLMESGPDRIIFLNNASGQPVSDLVINTGFRIANGSVESARGSKVSYLGPNRFSIPLQIADILLIRAAR